MRRSLLVWSLMVISALLMIEPAMACPWNGPRPGSPPPWACSGARRVGYHCKSGEHYDQVRERYYIANIAQKWRTSAGKIWKNRSNQQELTQIRTESCVCAKDYVCIPPRQTQHPGGGTRPGPRAG